MLVVLHSPIPHGVAPQQSSTMLQTAAAKVQNSFHITEILTMKCSLQFELLTTYYSKTACKMSYTPKINYSVFHSLFLFILSINSFNSLYSYRFIEFNFKPFSPPMFKNSTFSESIIILFTDCRVILSSPNT